MRKAIVFEAPRSGYGIDQIARDAMTVGELMDILAELPEDMLFVLSHDNGYTYGSIDRDYISYAKETPDGEFETVEDI